MRAVFGFLATAGIAAGQAAVDLAEVEVLGDPRRPSDRFTWTNGTQPLVSRSPGSRQRRSRARGWAMIEPTIDADEGILLGDGRDGTLTGGRFVSIRQLADAIEILATRNRELANQVARLEAEVQRLRDVESILVPGCARLEGRMEGLRPVVDACAAAFAAASNAAQEHDHRIGRLEEREDEDDERMDGLADRIGEAERRLQLAGVP